VATAHAGGLTRRAFILFASLLLASALVAALLGPILLGTWTPAPEALQALRATIPAAEAPEIPAVGEWFRTLVPTNPVSAAAEGAIVPLTIFAILFGIAAARLPNEGGKPLLAFFATIAEAMLVIVGWVLLLAPIGVFALAFAMAARLGLGAGAALAHYMAVQIGITLILGVSMYPLAALAGRVGLGAFARAAAPAQAVAASTQSSLASLPPMLAGAERLNVPGETSSVILPLAVAVFRIAAPATIVIVALTMARMSGVEVGLSQVTIIVALATINTLVIAGLPNQITFFAAYAPPALAAGIPIELLPLFLAVDTIPDIFYTITNVTADLSVTSVLGRQDPSRGQPG
jgi:Na+/H+-dicarboxylate symporter